MKDKSDTIAMLRQARRKLISLAVHARDAGNLREKGRWESRRKYIDEQLEQFSMLRDGSTIPQRVFVSYSARSEELYKHLKRPV